MSRQPQNINFIKLKRRLYQWEMEGNFFSSWFG